MELRIRQRIFSWTDSYDVYDEYGAPRYAVKADFFALTHRIRVFDIQTGREVGCIRQKLFTLLPTFELFLEDRFCGTVRKKFTLLRQNYEVDYRDWRVEGDFLGWEYQVMHRETEVMSISREFNLSDTYILRFARPDDEIPGLLLVIAIDAANCTHNN